MVSRDTGPRLRPPIRNNKNTTRGRVGAWLAVPKRSKSREGVREGLAWRSGGGARASVASFLTRTKRRKMAFFEGCPVGWGGVPTGAGLVDREAGQELGGGGARASVPGG